MKKQKRRLWIPAVAGLSILCLFLCVAAALSGGGKVAATTPPAVAVATAGQETAQFPTEEATISAAPATQTPPTSSPTSASPASSQAPAGTLQVHFIDVGQGNAVLVLTS